MDSIYNYLRILMSKIEPTIDLKEFSGLLFNLVANSCAIMHQSSSSTGVSWKGNDNPVTEIDYLIQQFIITGINNTYGPNFIPVIAEEDLTYSTCPEFQKGVADKLSEMKIDERKLQLPKCVEFQQRYQVKELCVWIDPLDCTQGFIYDRKHEVTILVGISYKGRPICGIIGHPYKPNKKGSLYAPSVYYGSSELQIGYAFQYNLFDSCWTTRPGVKGYENEEILHKMVTVGYRKMTPRQKGVIVNLGLTVVPAGGAGYKCIKLINREVGSLIFLDAKTSKWDTCAGEAIIRAMGGHTIAQNSNPISYQAAGSHENSIGFVFSLFHDVVETVINLVS